MPDVDQTVHYPIEFLNSLNPSGMPPHELKLKQGCPMLLRNRCPEAVQWRRLVVTHLHRYLIEATIAIGEFAGQSVLIPLIPSDSPFEFKRLQFPVTLSFAMSINKSQGQTLKMTGLYLAHPCFSHGQFYVGCSRVGTPSSLFIFTDTSNNLCKTRNVVYPEVLSI